MSLATKDIANQAIAAAHDSTLAMEAMSTFERKDILNYIAASIQKRGEEFANVLCVEAGKPVK